jgi:nucleotide-binding universal stress UspA family protein
MTYTALLVPVEGNNDPDYRLAFAVDLANQFDAKLIGVGAEIWRSPFGDIDGGSAMAELIESEIVDVEADLSRAEAKFSRVATTVRQGMDWRSALEFPDRKIATEARAADLIVTSRSTGRGASDYNVAAPGALVLQAGRPVIVAPAESRKLELESVLVAWKDTRESRRSVADALPFLKRARSVIVAEICHHDDFSATDIRLNDVAENLRLHGVHASTTVGIEEKDINAAHQFLDLADQNKADLIVAGAYGHSRFQEWVFGGFTRALLAQTSRAILLSH